MKKLCYFFLFLPFLFFAQSSKKYPSLLWKITGKNLKKPSYLYGTMHVSNRVAYYLSEQFFDALKSVDVVGLETSPGDWLENMEKNGELSELNQLRTANYASDFYRSVFSSRLPEKKMLQGILSYDPDIIDGLLYRQNRARENFEESTYIDLFIFQSASKLNKQLISLEDFAQSEIKAKLSALPDEASERNEKNYQNMVMAGQGIEDAYREGNLDLLDSLSKLTSSKNTQRYLIDDRNVFFVNTMDSVLKTKTLFSGVGAAHLPGKNGVIELLRQKGYTVEPVMPKVSKKSHAIREELDAMVKPVSFQKQSIPDSLFSVKLPGKLYPILSLENLNYYIHADMVNGNFYTVVRLRHNAPMYQLSPEKMMARLDSLLFESIPGKIIEKKNISVNGVKGLEIINRTRRGDDQHYQIFFTELEMILFKLGGKHQYATGNEAKQFFNSITFAPKGNEEFVFSPKTKGFKVSIPANYTYLKNDGSSMIGLVEDLFAYNSAKKHCYGVKQAVYNDFNYLEEDTFELNRLAKNVLLNFNFTLAPQTSLTREQGFPCIRVSAANTKAQYLNAKIYIKGVHYYLVYTVNEQAADFNNSFFNSFQLLDFEYVNKLKQISDKDFHFKAIDEVSENALTRFNEAYMKAYEKIKPKADSIKNDYDAKNLNKLYYSPSSNEYVSITYEKFNDYDYRNKSEIEKKIAEGFKNTTSMVLSAAKTTQQGNLFRYNCLLKDTATARAIDVRVFIRNGMMHQVCAPFDTTIGLRGWAKGFMDSFTPDDTLIGKNIFENKFALLLNDLCSNDTVVRQAANNSLRNAVGMQKDFGDEYVKFIGSKRVALVGEDSRAQLFVNGGTIENEKIIEPYKLLYKQYTDSFYLQLCLLKGLAFLKTKDSYAAFNNLLLNETPLVGSDASVSDVFAILHDSLALCKNFFPGMLALTKYDEYRDAVYCLLADLVNQKLVSPQVYALQKEKIIIEANLAMKRYTPGNTKPQAGEESGLENLDKNLKELAENLRGNLNNFANNNLYKGTAYLKNLDVSNRPVLVNYAYVLSPFYKTDDKVKQLFAKLTKLKAQNLLMPITINLLKQNVTVNDTLVSYFCKNKYTRAFFYSELEKEKLTDRFDKNYLNQKSLNESLVNSQKQLKSFYNYDKDKNKKDSLVLLKTLEAANKYQRGKIYIYKQQKNKNDDEQWNAIFVEDTKEPVNSKIEIISSGYYIDNTKTETENVNELLDYFYTSYRKRANTANNNQ